MTKFERFVFAEFKGRVENELTNLSKKEIGAFVIGHAGGYQSAIEDFGAEISQEFLKKMYDYGKSFLYDNEEETNEE